MFWLYLYLIALLLYMKTLAKFGILHIQNKSICRDQPHQLYLKRYLNKHTQIITSNGHFQLIRTAANSWPSMHYHTSCYIASRDKLWNMFNLGMTLVWHPVSPYRCLPLLSFLLQFLQIEVSTFIPVVNWKLPGLFSSLQDVVAGGILSTHTYLAQERN